MLSPARHSAGVLATWQGKWGVPSSFFLFPLTQETYLFLRYLSQTCTDIQLFCLSLDSLFLFPTPLIYSGIWRRQPCPTQRCQKWGLLDRGPGPTPPPPPHASRPSAPPDGFITSYAAHLKPIESLGGQECLTQISTSEGVSATLENCWLGFGVVFVF